MSPLREQAIAKINTMSEHQLSILIQLINSLKDFNSKSDEQSEDPFYHPANLQFIDEGIKALREGKGVVHDLIEVD